MSDRQGQPAFGDEAGDPFADVLPVTPMAVPPPMGVWPSTAPAAPARSTMPRQAGVLWTFIRPDRDDS